MHHTPLRIIYLTALVHLLITGAFSGDRLSTPSPAPIPNSPTRDSLSAVLVNGAIDTVTRPPDSIDRVLDSVAAIRATAAPVVPRPLASPLRQADTPASRRPADTFSVVSGTTGGIGIGLSIGSLPVLKHWKNGLPATLSDLLPFKKIMSPSGDTIPLTFTVKEQPDVYNMMFPLGLSLSRLSPHHRVDCALGIATLSKSFHAAIALDSQRNISLEQSIRYLTVLIECTYGAAIPELFFSVDKVDRTDAFIGVGASPYIGLRSDVRIRQSPETDEALQSVRDSLVVRATGFEAAGVAISGRLGIAMLRKVSPTGGLETRLSWQGVWCTRFRSGENPLTVATLNPRADEPESSVSYFSTRFDITFSLIRRVF